MKRYVIYQIANYKIILQAKRCGVKVKSYVFLLIENKTKKEDRGIHTLTMRPIRPNLNSAHSEPAKHLTAFYTDMYDKYVCK